MRLGLKLLNSNSSLNQISEIPFLRLARGETADLMFQIVDLDQKGLRYIPAAGATVKVQIPRSPQILPDPNGTNNRITADYSIDQAVSPAFADDKSIYKLPLLATQTATMISTNVRVVVTEGSQVKIATLTQAIKIIDNQEN